MQDRDCTFNCSVTKHDSGKEEVNSLSFCGKAHTVAPMWSLWSEGNMIRFKKLIIKTVKEQKTEFILQVQRFPDIWSFHPMFRFAVSKLPHFLKRSFCFRLLWRRWIHFFKGWNTWQIPLQRHLSGMTLDMGTLEINVYVVFSNCSSIKCLLWYYNSTYKWKREKDEILW